MDPDSATQDIMSVIYGMMKDPPNADVPIPPSNHYSTACGVSIPFCVLSMVAVGLRLFTRMKIVRQLGWDDFFVAIAAVFNIIALATFLGAIKHGLGQHLISILAIFPTTMKWFYVTSSAYITTTICIKLSLLCQYLRMWRNGYRRSITMVLFIMIILWGGAFTFMTWVPCFPVRGYWDKFMNPPAKCYAFGYRTASEAKTTLLAFTGSNMVFDIAVFSVPLTEYLKPDLKRKQVLALTGLFLMGFIVVLMSALRLWSGMRYNNRGYAMYDFTFWWPEVALFGCLEVDFAIICASIPIFWPTMMAAWTQITVTHEVIVTSESHPYTDHEAKDMELNRIVPESLKRQDSTEGLVDCERMKERVIIRDPQVSKMGRNKW
ncbi:hypothetical protein E8E13_009793 [Curvularia kusanoi]|uniref:Rhodopsin domain-containing protein n=1 Tax=Curvularia kusanoi TaxID=90978 RepID=A0A9P4TIR7_CURKU|nr:hypothetical protein E8E13_009793 [Curvularia kusanoi]